MKAEGDLYTANKALLDPWLAYLAAIGWLFPDAQPPVKTAMVIAAKDPGSNGNFIQIVFSNFDETDPNDPKFDTTVTETNLYTGLTPPTVQTVLGAARGAGRNRGWFSCPAQRPRIYPKPGAIR